VDKFPKGMPQLAACINSDDVFAHFRRFGRLSALILLDRQIALTELEKKIDDLDEADDKDPIMQSRLDGHEGYKGWDNGKRKLIDEASVKYLEYGERLVRMC
jgi:hypothetical protein